MKSSSCDYERPKRKRRTAVEARAAILAATEKRLIEGGPDALRLQEVAAEVGISHSTVLHHFGSRDQLLDDFADHALGLLQADLVCVFQHSSDHPGDSYEERVDRTAQLLEEVSRVLNDRGYARLLAWLVLTDRQLPEAAEGIFRGLSQVVTQSDEGSAVREGEASAEVDSASCGATLAVVSLIGNAFFGKVARHGVGLPSGSEIELPLHRWIAELIHSRNPSAR